MNWNSFLMDNRMKFPKDSHGLFSASNYHWINYSMEKAIAVYNNAKIKELGIRRHDLAARLIHEKVLLPDTRQTFNMYVNDAIRFSMIPEKQLYYSDEFRGTADAITVDVDFLRIHDLKMGEVKASMKQLEIYAALFCLDFGCNPSDLSGIELRIYQNDDIAISHPEADYILSIMSKIVDIDRLISSMKEGYND